MASRGLKKTAALKSTFGLSRIWSENNRYRAAFLFGFASIGSWMPLFNLWLEDRGMNGAGIGYIAAIPWIVMLVVQPLWGVWADKTGKRNCFYFSLGMSSLLFLLFPMLSSGKISIILMTVLFALFQTPVLPLLDSLALDYIARSGRASAMKIGKNNGPGTILKAVSYSSLRFWGAPGFALGGFLTGNLISIYGIDQVFYISGGFLLLTLIAGISFTHTNASVPAADINFNGLIQVLDNRALLGFLCLVLLVSVAQSSSTFYLTVYMREIGASSAMTGTAIAIQGFSELPFYFIAAWLLRRMPAIHILLIAVFGTALRLFLYSINKEPGMVLGIETLNGVTWTLLWIASVDFVNGQVPVAWRTTGQSLLWAMYFGAGAVLGNIFSGRLYESLPMKQVFGINSMLIFSMGLVSLFMFKKNYLKKLTNE